MGDYYEKFNGDPEAEQHAVWEMGLIDTILLARADYAQRVGNARRVIAAAPVGSVAWTAFATSVLEETRHFLETLDEALESAYVEDDWREGEGEVRHDLDDVVRDLAIVEDEPT